MTKHLLATVALAVFVTGCSRQVAVEGRPPVYPTSVTVLHNGEPLEEATVTLRPIDSPFAAYGKTDSRGVVRLTTFDPEDGAVEGEHEVRIRKVELETAPDPRPGNPDGYKIISETSMIPERYESFEDSGLTIQIEPQAENTTTLELTE